MNWPAAFEMLSSPLLKGHAQSSTELLSFDRRSCS